MPTVRLKCAIPIIAKALVVLLMAFPPGALTTADAAGKVVHPAGKRKPVAKKSAHRTVKAAKSKRSQARRGRVTKPTNPPSKTSFNDASASLTLANDLKLAQPVTVMRQRQAVRQETNESNLPPLQIGKTLYQRNGEIRLRESDTAEGIGTRSGQVGGHAALDKPG